MDVPISCICPPKPDGQPRHAGDTVTLPEILDFRATLIVRQSIRLAVQMAREEGEVMSLAEMTAIMAEAYLLHGISGWTVVDEKGKPVPASRAAIRQYLLTNYEAAEAVGNVADDLYSDKVVLPLLQGASSSSPATPTEGSMSPTSGNGSTPRRKQPKRSSTFTTQMAVTGPMAASPAGVSS